MFDPNLKVEYYTSDGEHASDLYAFTLGRHMDYGWGDFLNFRVFLSSEHLASDAITRESV